MWLRGQEGCEWLVTKVKPAFERLVCQMHHMYVGRHTHIHTTVCSVIRSRDLMVSFQQLFFFFFMRRENEEASLGGHYNNPGKGLQGHLPC